MAILLYLLVCAYYGRRNPLLYLLFPLALQQGPAAFIDQTISVAGKNLFSPNDMIFNDFLFFLLCCIAIVLIRARVPSLRGLGSKLMLGYLVYVVLIFLADYLGSGDKAVVIFTAREFIYISLNYFLWLSVFSAVERRHYESFLRLLFYITPVSGMLYILNSGNIISIFPKELIYAEVDLSVGTTIRDFATIPLFLSAIVVLSVQSMIMPIMKVPKLVILGNLVILPIALLFTFTRSIIISVVMQIVFILILQSLKKGAESIRTAIVFIILFGISLGPAYLIADNIFPNQTEYFVGRFADVSKEGKDEENVNIRLAYFNKAVEITNYTSPAFGAGMNRKYYQQMNDIGAWKADSTVPFLLYHTGWIGVILMYVILLWFSAQSVMFYLRTGDWLVSFLASGFITLTISSLMTGGSSLYGSLWTFMNFAIFIVTKYGLWKRQLFRVYARPHTPVLNYSS